MTVYFFQVGLRGPIKIGKTSIGVNYRLNTIRASMPFPVHLLGVIENAADDLESILHYRFRGSRIRGEWFKPIPELLAFIQAETTSPRKPMFTWMAKEQRDRLEQQSAITGLSIPEIISQALDAYLESPELL
jgi:hypothetical protein